MTDVVVLVMVSCLAPVSSADNYPSAEELVAKARAPVKREYVIFNTGPRVMAKSIVITNTPQEGTADAPETSNVVSAKASGERKSKRQLKRERQEVRSIILSCERSSCVLEISSLQIRV